MTASTGQLAICELLRKREQLRVDLAGIEHACSQLRGDIETLESALRLLGHNQDLPETSHRPRRYKLFAPGEISRAVADIKRTKPDLVKPRDIAREIMVAKNWDSADFNLWVRASQAVRDCLKRRRRMARQKEGG